MAAQSAEAAKNSGELILEAMRAVDEGKAIVDETARTLLESVSKTDALVENIGEISAASDKQAQALDPGKHRHGRRKLRKQRRISCTGREVKRPRWCIQTAGKLGPYLDS